MAGIHWDAVTAGRPPPRDRSGTLKPLAKRTQQNHTAAANEQRANDVIPSSEKLLELYCCRKKTSCRGGTRSASQPPIMPLLVQRDSAKLLSTYANRRRRRPRALRCMQSEQQPLPGPSSEKGYLQTTQPLQSGGGSCTLKLPSASHKNNAACKAGKSL
jgi:hypothetical protein